jgi:hypothetical protein
LGEATAGCAVSTRLRPIYLLKLVRQMSVFFDKNSRPRRTRPWS